MPKSPNSYPIIILMMRIVSTILLALSVVAILVTHIVDIPGHKNKKQNQNKSAFNFISAFRQSFSIVYISYLMNFFIGEIRERERKMSWVYGGLQVFDSRKRHWCLVQCFPNGSCNLPHSYQKITAVLPFRIVFWHPCRSGTYFSSSVLLKSPSFLYIDLSIIIRYETFIYS